MRLLRQHGPNGTMALGIMLEVFKTNHRGGHQFANPSLWWSSHLLILRARTQLKSLETGGLMFLSLWQQQHHSKFSFLFNFCNQTTTLSCVLSVLKCPWRCCMRALTSKGWDEWHVRTQNQRGGEKRTNLSIFDCGAALLSSKLWRSLYWPLTQQGTWISNKMQK